MENKFDQKMLTDLLLTIISALVLQAVSHYAAPYVTLLTPIPFIMLQYKRGSGANLVAHVITGLILYVFFDAGSAVIYSALTLPFSVAVGEMLRRKTDYMKIIFIGTIILVIVFVGSYFALTYFAKMDVIESLEKTMESLMVNPAVLQEQLNMSEEQIFDLTKTLKNSINMLIVSLPGLTVAVSFVASVANVFLAKVYLSKTSEELNYIPKFNELRLPQNMKVGIVTIVVALIVFSLMDFKFMQELLMNVLWISYGIFGVQGIAVVDYFLQFKVGKVFRVILPLVLLIMFRFFDFYLIIGVVDVFANLRRRRLKI